MRLAPLVFVRPGELRQAEWSEIDLAAAGLRWSIPAEKMKMRRDHIVPLSKQAVEIITEIHSLTGQGRYLFPCNRTNGRCLSNMALNAVLRRMGYDQGEMCAQGPSVLPRRWWESVAALSPGLGGRAAGDIAKPVVRGRRCPGHEFLRGGGEWAIGHHYGPLRRP